MTDAARVTSQKRPTRSAEWEQAFLGFLQALLADTEHIEDAWGQLARVYCIGGLMADETDAVHKLLNILEEQGDWATSLAVLRRLADLEQNSDRARKRLVALLEQLGEVPEMVLQARRLAGFYHLQSRGDLVIATLRRIVKACPDSREAELDLAEALASDGQLQEGGRWFRKVANAYREQGQFNKSVEVLRRLKQYTPDDIGLLMTLGNLYRNLDLDSLAEQYYRAVLSLEQEHQEALLSLARLCQRNGRRRHSVLAYQHYLKLNPDDAVAIEDLGALFHEMGAVAEAVRHYCLAAQAYIKHEDEDSARRLFGTVLTLDPRNPVAMRELRRLAEAEGSEAEGSEAPASLQQVHS